jgi:serine/threonine protein phosphatase PrpC
MITHTISLLGLRDSNEDQHEVFINLNNENSEFKDINFFAVFDGHGGKDVSKYLKENLPNYFTNKYIKYHITNSIKFKKYIEKVFDHIQIKLEKRFKNLAYNIGSTALIIIFYKKQGKINYYVANTGDCRAVVCNNSNMSIPLTKDHKPHLFEEKARIEKLGGEIYNDGYDWRIGDLSVSRAFGDMDASPYVTHKPQLFKYNLRKNDKFLVLACDGLWDVITNQDATNFVLNKLNNTNKLVTMSGYSKQNIAQSLGEYAIANGSTDNVSIIIIFFDD